MINTAEPQKDDDRKWKVLSSEYLYREPWFTVRHECVELPTGSRIPDYYVLEYPDWVCILAITKEQQFVFVRQYRHGSGHTSYELCAGVCEVEDVTPLASAQRELLEETGFGGGQWSEYMLISANPGTHSNMTHCFLAIGVEPIANSHLDSTEDLSVHLLSLDEVRNLLKTGAIEQALHAAPLWKYMAENKCM